MTQSLKSVNVITLFVEDPLRSKEFYERIFDVVGVDEGHGTVILPLDNVFLRLLSRREAESEMLGQVSVGDLRSGTAVQFAFRVDDADAFCTELSEHGVSIVLRAGRPSLGRAQCGVRRPRRSRLAVRLRHSRELSGTGSASRAAGLVPSEVDVA